MCLNSANDESMKMQCSEVLEIFTPNSTVNSNSVYIIIAHFGNRYFLLTKIEAPMLQIKNAMYQMVCWWPGVGHYHLIHRAREAVFPVLMQN